MCMVLMAAEQQVGDGNRLVVGWQCLHGARGVITLCRACAARGQVITE